MTTLNHCIQIIFSCLAEDESKFTYHEDTGKGPSKWGNMDPLWKACGNGKLQSPIDLLNRRVQVIRNYNNLKRNYKPAQAFVKNRGHDIMVSCQLPLRLYTLLFFFIVMIFIMYQFSLRLQA